MYEDDFLEDRYEALWELDDSDDGPYDDEDEDWEPGDSWDETTAVFIPDYAEPPF